MHAGARRAGLIVGVVLLVACSAKPWRVVRVTAAAATDVPAYDKDGKLLLAADYREWIFLSSGLDMVYGPKAAVTAEHSIFDNVFVNLEAYRSFLKTGTWPDKTVLVLEIRGATTAASINHGGHTQGPAVMGTEVHVKDKARFPGGWAFFDVASDGVGKLIPQPASCYTCHREHAAVDTTFAQFYPTLLPVAERKGTLSPAYVTEFPPGAPGR